MALTDYTSEPRDRTHPQPQRTAPERSIEHVTGLIARHAHKAREAPDSDDAIRHLSLGLDLAADLIQTLIDRAAG